MPFLPMTISELTDRNWNYLDVIIITGDAYVDHPSFGAAIIGRSLEAKGYRVGIIAQPEWRLDASKNPSSEVYADFKRLGKPKLFFGITAGNMDSMVNHYTAQRKLRHDDAYSPNGIAGKRPDRATMVYTNIIKSLYKGVPVVIGGIEASLRRIAHYDYWQDKTRNSILADSKADMLIYGMAESPICCLADHLSKGSKISEIQDLPSSVVFSLQAPKAEDVVLPSADSCKDKQTFYQMTKQFMQSNSSATLFQMNGTRMLRHNPPAKPLSTQEMDNIYSLPFQYAPHPAYQNAKIPAFEQIKSSLTSHRGCYGGCNFCAIACHQGRAIQSRSHASILKEAGKHSGTISDVGGPTANMYASICKIGFPVSCSRNSCLYPAICPNLIMNHDDQLNLLDSISKLPRIKHVYIASGIRHDMALRHEKYIKAIATKYTGGRLKLAPEHCVTKVLKLMGKPDISGYEDFCTKFYAITNQAGIKRQIIPYLIIGHPGTTREDAINLRNWLKSHNIKVEQVQEFTPTPMSISTCMYYTGLDFDTGKPIEIPSPGQIREQKKMVVE